jgi:hypothetical protein
MADFFGNSHVFAETPTAPIWHFGWASENCLYSFHIRLAARILLACFRWDSPLLFPLSE